MENFDLLFEKRNKWGKRVRDYFKMDFFFIYDGIIFFFFVCEIKNGFFFYNEN